MLLLDCFVHVEGIVLTTARWPKRKKNIKQQQKLTLKEEEEEEEKNYKKRGKKKREKITREKRRERALVRDRLQFHGALTFVARLNKRKRA